jgi:hypothetical protein
LPTKAGMTTKMQLLLRRGQRKSRRLGYANRGTRGETKTQDASKNSKDVKTPKKIENKIKTEMVFGSGEYIQKNPKKELSLLSLLNNLRRR